LKAIVPEEMDAGVAPAASTFVVAEPAIAEFPIAAAADTSAAGICAWVWYPVTVND